MRLLHSFLTSAALLIFPLTAYASPVTFAFTGIGGGFDPPNIGIGATYSGTITIDTATYQVTAENIEADVSNGNKYYFNDSVFGTTSSSPDYSTFFLGETSSYATSSAGSTESTALHISFFDPTSGTYSGGSTIFAQSGITFSSGGYVEVSATIGPAIPSVATTPEPSSLILLGTGALSLVGAAGRRLLNR